jgi:hypothetical protein
MMLTRLSTSMSLPATAVDPNKRPTEEASIARPACQGRPPFAEHDEPWTAARPSPQHRPSAGCTRTFQGSPWDQGTDRANQLRMQQGRVVVLASFPVASVW